MSCKNWKGRVQRIWKWYLPICIIPSQYYQPGDSRFWTISPGLQIRVWNLLDNRRKFSFFCGLDFLTMKFQIFCVVWIIIILMLTLRISSQTPICNFDISNNVIGQMLQCQQHLFWAFCVTANIRDDRIQRVFFAQMTSPIIPSLSTLNICKCWGLAALPSLSVNNPHSLISLSFCLNFTL